MNDDDDDDCRFVKRITQDASTALIYNNEAVFMLRKLNSGELILSFFCFVF